LQLSLGVRPRINPNVIQVVDHYTKLAVVAFRSLGLMILLYAGPMLLLGILRHLAGATTASDGSKAGPAFIGWFVYGLTGVLLVLLAKPLARFAARGLGADVSM
jgi:hypothetical protein